MQIKGKRLIIAIIIVVIIVIVIACYNNSKDSEEDSYLEDDYELTDEEIEYLLDEDNAELFEQYFEENYE